MKVAIVRLFVLFVFSVSLLIALAAEAQSQIFKVGDSVEAAYGTQWLPGVVVKLDNGGYTVAAGSEIIHTMMTPDSIRPHRMTADEQAAGDVSARALATWPAGNGIGAQYGAREPATCQTRGTAPTNADIARYYLMCDMEGVDGFGDLSLLTDVTVQVGSPRAFIYSQDAARAQIDVRAPVYDLRGGYKEYQCGKPDRRATAYVATHTCNAYPQPQAAGVCYRTTFGEWHCRLTGSRLASTNQIVEQMPPR